MAQPLQVAIKIPCPARLFVARRKENVKIIKKIVIKILKKYLWKLPDDMLNRALSYAIIHRKFPTLLASERVQNRENLWRATLDVIGSDKQILFLEFGVYQGDSIRFFSRELTNSDSKLIGFDSFQGLPEDWGHRSAGSYSAKGKIPTIDDQRVNFEIGWFQDTLPLLQFHGEKYDAVLVHMDADLYSSTLFVLSELWHRFVNVYVIFDEFVGDEARALFNFTQAFPCKVAFILHDAYPPKRVACIISGMRGEAVSEI